MTNQNYISEWMDVWCWGWMDIECWNDKDVVVKTNPNSDSGFFAIQKNDLENLNSHFEKKIILIKFQIMKNMN